MFAWVQIPPLQFMKGNKMKIYGCNLEQRIIYKNDVAEFIGDNKSIEEATIYPECKYRYLSNKIAICTTYELCPYKTELNIKNEIA